MGIIARNPLNATEPITVTARVKMETNTLFISILSPTRPAIEAAVGASSNPMMAMIAPIAAGGKMKSIHRVPRIRSTGEIKAKLEPR